jgi:hypothetical protein
MSSKDSSKSKTKSSSRENDDGRSKSNGSKKDKDTNEDRGSRKKKEGGEGGDASASAEGSGDGGGKKHDKDKGNQKKKKQRAAGKSKKDSKGKPKMNKKGRAAAQSSSNGDEEDDAKEDPNEGVSVVKDSKETFEQLQARKAQNLRSCRQALCGGAVAGFVLLVVGAGLLVALGYAGRCTDPLFPYACGSFECCASACEDDGSTNDDGSSSSDVSGVVGKCALIIINPLEAAGVTLLVVGVVALVGVVVCVLQVNRRTSARVVVPAVAYGCALLLSFVLIAVAVVAFAVGATLPSDSTSTIAVVAGSNATGGEDELVATSAADSLFIVAVSTVWPGVLLLVGAMVGLHLRWRSTVTSRKRLLLVLGLRGSGKSHVASELMGAAERQTDGGSDARDKRRSSSSATTARSGALHDTAGRPTAGNFALAVVRPDGLSMVVMENAGTSAAGILGCAATTTCARSVCAACPPAVSIPACLSCLFARLFVWPCLYVCAVQLSVRLLSMCTLSPADVFDRSNWCCARNGSACTADALVFVVDACNKARLQEAGLFLEVRPPCAQSGDLDR